MRPLKGKKDEQAQAADSAADAPADLPVPPAPDAPADKTDDSQEK